MTAETPGWLGPPWPRRRRYNSSIGQLVQLWQGATDAVLRHLTGFVSANVHRSFDGTKVVNYAQWESREAFQAMLAKPDAHSWLEQLAEIGTPAPVLCEVVSTHHASA